MHGFANRTTPLTFRQNTIQSIFRFVTAGDSCLIVGTGSVGKSNLLRFIQNEDILNAYLGEVYEHFLVVYIDVNKALERSSWGLFELILHQILMALTSKTNDEKILQAIDDLHQRTTEPQTRYLALRFVDRAIHLVCYQLKMNLVFLIDEFDTLCSNLSASDFSALRALRDDNKYRLMYVVTSRAELNRLVEKTRDIEPFEELVSPNTVWLGPYSESDAKVMLQRLNTRYGVMLDEETTRKLLVATGGHPALLRAAHRTTLEQPDHLIDALMLSPQVFDECDRIWHSLKDDEQKMLIDLTINKVPSTSDPEIILYKLKKKGMIGGPWAKGYDIFSTLFAEFVKRCRRTTNDDIQIDHDRRLVLVEGKIIEGLSTLEFGLIEYLESRRGQVCTRDELAEHLYPEDVIYGEDGVSDARLGTIIARVRREIEPEPKSPKYILTVRGHGYKLIDKQECIL